MINPRQFLIDEYNAGRLWRRNTNESLRAIKESGIKGLASEYLKAREILKKAGEPADKPLTYSICRALNEGFLQPDFKIKDNGERERSRE
ncbi:MAG: hypothetical protein QX189_04920 [Methylococcales bacterium]